MMKVLCIFQKFSFQSSTIYLDLVNALTEAGHQVTILAGTSEAVDAGRIHSQQGCRVAYVSLPDQFKSGRIKKGFVQLMMEPKMILKMKQLLKDSQFDLVIYPTPPITLANVVGYAKKTYRAKTYLMLKDIFPQNAADLHMMSQKGMLFRYFTHVEKKLYANSDYIGCMSEKNITYMKKRLSEKDCKKLELFPNTVKVNKLRKKAQEERKQEPVRFVLGGNLGLPQALDFLMEGIEKLKDYDKASFLIVGEGTQAEKVKKYIEEKKLTNVEYHRQLPREEYEKMLEDCQVGLVLLNPDFTIPNYPSRILSYMQKGKAILAATDRVTDMKELLTRDAQCGFWCPSDDTDAFVSTVKEICDRREELDEIGNKGYQYLKENYAVERSVRILEGKHV